MKFGIVGAMGKMGQTIARTAKEKKGLLLTTVIEKKNSPFIKKNYTSVSGIQNYPMSIITMQELETDQVEGLIDFSTPRSSLEMLEKIKGTSICAVIGTTGFSQSEWLLIEKYSQSNAILLSANMSLGMNILFWLVKNTAKIIKKYDFDPEIVEAHHKHKKDSPSGTARTLEKILLEELGWETGSSIYGRQGIIGSRPERELGVHAIRGGSVVGEHSVHFLGEGENIELHHQALDRSIFALGALQALLFLVGQKPGLYSMNDVLALR